LQQDYGCRTRQSRTRRRPRSSNGIIRLINFNL
jgi:hypothetical protein